MDDSLLICIDANLIIYPEKDFFFFSNLIINPANCYMAVLESYLFFILFWYMNIHLPNFLCFHNLQFQTMLNNFVCMYLYIIGCIPSRKSPVSGIIESKCKRIYIFVAKFPSGRIMIVCILPSSKICECWLPHSLANRIWSYFLIFTNWEKL